MVLLKVPTIPYACSPKTNDNITSVGCNLEKLPIILGFNRFASNECIKKIHNIAHIDVVIDLVAAIKTIGMVLIIEPKIGIKLSIPANPLRRNE